MSFGSVNYQSDLVARSLLTTGHIYVDRAVNGTDSKPVGLDTTPVRIAIANARNENTNLNEHGMALVQSVSPSIDFYDEQQILTSYYSDCCRIVQEATGARKVFAYDHNIRQSVKKSWLNADGTESKEIVGRQATGNSKVIKGGSEVQAPAAIVHNDFSLTSAPRRLRQLAEAPRLNDTLRKVLGNAPLISADELTRAIADGDDGGGSDNDGGHEGGKGRYVFINLWRNITEYPVEDMPLALCDARTIAADDLITFEIRYADRVGENYFARHRNAHRWLYYPKMTKDEALLIKVWDSAGALALDATRPSGHTQTVGNTAADTTNNTLSTFSFHSAFKDENAPVDCPSRESIEVRLLALF